MRARKVLIFAFCLTIIAIFFFASGLSAQNITLGLSISEGEVRDFYLSISSYFKVPEARILEIQKSYRLADEELPVVFFIAARARVEPVAVLNLRVKGMSWWDISVHFGLSPEIFFIPVGLVRIGPPYGRAYGYYHQYRQQKTWGKVILNDVDVVNLVNLRFISEHHQIPPERVMEMRGRGEKFLDIHDKIIKEKGQSEASDKDKSKDQPVKKTKRKK